MCVCIFNLMVMWILNMRSTFLTNAVDCRCNAAQQVSRTCLSYFTETLCHRLPTPHSRYPLPSPSPFHSFMNLTILDIL